VYFDVDVKPFQQIKDHMDSAFKPARSMLAVMVASAFIGSQPAHAVLDTPIERAMMLYTN